MSDGKILCRHLQIVICFWLMGACIGSEPIFGQTTIRLPANEAINMQRLRKLSVPALTDAIIVRGKSKSESLRLANAVAKAYPRRAEVQVVYDDFATFGRFCDSDAPYHVLVKEGSFTAHDEECFQWRFPATASQPKEFVVGQLQIIVVAHKSSRVDSLTLSQVGNALRKQDEGSQEQVIAKTGAKAHCFGLPENSWTRTFIQEKCMASWQETDTPGVRRLLRSGYRDDLVSCHNAKEILAQVSNNRRAFGFFAWDEKLTKADMAAVKVISISLGEGQPSVAPSLETIIDDAYPLAQRVSLWLHPDAPPQAREFCEFAAGPEGAAAVKRHGIWTKAEIDTRRGKDRLAEVKKGKGVPIVCAGTAAGQKLVEGLGLEFVETRMTVQVHYQKHSTTDAARQLTDGKAEMLLLVGAARLAAPTGAEKLLLGTSALGVITNAQSKVDSLLWDELKKICAGEIKSWPAAKDDELVIHGYALPPSESVMQIFGEHLTPRQKNKALKLAKQANTAEVIAAVAKDPGGIGFIDLSQVLSLDGSVTLIELVMPDKTAVRVRPNHVPDNYPLAQTLTLCCAESASEPAKSFFAWLAEHPCEKTMARNHLIARKPPEKKRQPASAPKPILVAGQLVPTSDAELGLVDPDAVEEPKPDQN